MSIGIGINLALGRLGTGVPANALLLEDGSPLLLEDGSYLLLET